MLYFAFGSNMMHEQMLERCPRSRFVEKGRLVGYEFVYDGYSSSRQCAVANVIPKPQSFVWGGLFEIDEHDLKILDRLEGFPHSYNRSELEVLDGAGNKHIAITYFRVGKEKGQPSEEYRDIIRKGIIDCGLPNDCAQAVE